MDEKQIEIAELCLKGGEEGTKSFPQIVEILTKNNFEGYSVDFRRGTVTYFTVDGKSFELPSVQMDLAVSPEFNRPEIQSAIREAQREVPGYTYSGFCQKVTAAGCAGYMVSFPGRRVLYFGRTAETHTEYFPA